MQQVKIIDAGHCHWKLPKESEPTLVTANRPKAILHDDNVVAISPWTCKCCRCDEAIKPGIRSIMVVRLTKFFSGTRSEQTTSPSKQKRLQNRTEQDRTEQNRSNIGYYKEQNRTEQIEHFTNFHEQNRTEQTELFLRIFTNRTEFYPFCA
ncbi:hypothetical protein G9A89_012962 [Geosiphon pyriformis]|nr:hypothetical protein G9A89_012962 [Geosiphon pyriformis]